MHLKLLPLGSITISPSFRINSHIVATVNSLHHHIRLFSRTFATRHETQIGHNSTIFLKNRHSQMISFSKFVGSTKFLSRCFSSSINEPRTTPQDSNITESMVKPDDPQANLVWIDLEMTGLDINKDTILEIAVIVTDSELNIVCEGPEIVIHHPESVLTTMNEWSTRNHQMTGLVNEVRKSSISMEQAEQLIIEAISPHITRGRSLLAGSSVHTDRKFLNKYMPKLLGILHHRIIDVTSIRELCKRWFNEELTKMPDKRIQHRALEDIRQSIEELKYYKKAVFKPVSPSNQSS